MRWLFPGRLVTVEAPCLCCGEPIVVETRDDGLLRATPETTVGYTRSAVGGEAATRPFR